MRLFRRRTGRTQMGKPASKPPARREPLVVPEELSGAKIGFVQRAGVNIAGLWPGRYPTSEAVRASLNRANEERDMLRARGIKTANQETVLQWLTQHAVWLKKQL